MLSWNCGPSGPESLTGDPQNSDLLDDALHSVDSPPDIIVFGLQEVIDLESRKMMAYNVLLGASGKKKADDGPLETVSGAYKKWEDHLALAVRTAMPKDVTYCLTHCESLIGLFSCIFVKNKEKLDDVSVTTIKRGMKGWYGNKVCGSNFSSHSLQHNYLFFFSRPQNRVGSFRVWWLVIHRYVLSIVILLLVTMRSAIGIQILREYWNKKLFLHHRKIIL